MVISSSRYLYKDSKIIILFIIKCIISLLNSIKSFVRSYFFIKEFSIIIIKDTILILKLLPYITFKRPKYKSLTDHVSKHF